MPNILVLDDEPNLVALIAAILEREGYSVAGFSNPLHALEALPKLHVDAFVVDVEMPQMRGLEFLARLRAQPQWRTTPFLFLSGLTTRQQRRAGMELGADDYLDKPLDTQELLAALALRLSRQPPAEPAWPGQGGLIASALGGRRVTVGGKVLAWRSEKTAELFFYLLDAAAPRSNLEIIEALWSGQESQERRVYLHTSMHRLRKMLGTDIVIYENNKYVLQTNLILSYDVAQYQQIVQECTLNPKIELIEQAIKLYNGPFLGQMEAEWCLAKRDALAASHLQLLLAAVALAEQQQELRQAAWYAHLATQHDPYGEAGWSELARLWEQLGDSRRAALARQRQLGWEG
jgi:two-component SAPR family response regulator